MSTWAHFGSSNQRAPIRPSISSPLLSPSPSLRIDSVTLILPTVIVSPFQARCTCKTFFPSKNAPFCSLCGTMCLAWRPIDWHSLNDFFLLFMVRTREARNLWAKNQFVFWRTASHIDRMGMCAAKEKGAPKGGQVAGVPEYERTAQQSSKREKNRCFALYWHEYLTQCYLLM